MEHIRNAYSGRMPNACLVCVSEIDINVVSRNETYNGRSTQNTSIRMWTTRAVPSAAYSSSAARDCHSRSGAHINHVLILKTLFRQAVCTACRTSHQIQIRSRLLAQVIMRCLIYCMRDVMHDALASYETERKIQRVGVISANSHRNVYMCYTSTPALQGCCVHFCIFQHEWRSSRQWNPENEKISLSRVSENTRR